MLGKFLISILQFVVFYIQRVLSFVAWKKPPKTAIPDRLEVQKLRKALDSANTYDEWKDVAQELDKILGNDAWKEQPLCQDYDYKLIHFRLAKLLQLRQKDDVLNLIHHLRSGLLRNLGGISDPRLYSTCYLGTKRIIQDYTREVVAALNYIANGEHPELTHQAAIDFFHEIKQSFGCSALILEGGATFGLYHLGVVKALHDQDLLPKIISGSAVGSLIAALVCIHPEDELKEVFYEKGINLSSFKTKSRKGHLRRKFFRWLKYGHLLDVKVLEDCVRSNVGDLTFEEAYHRTRRILNITVASERPHEVPKVLNFLTAPNVLIWSAACASTAATYPLYSQVHLLAKDTQGAITKWNPTGSDINWVATSATSLAIPSFTNTSEQCSPYHRLAELFNVNHVIVSQAGALAAPMVLRGWRERHSFLARLVSAFLMEFRHRVMQLSQCHVIPGGLARWFAPETMTGDVTITPELQLKDYKNLFSNPTTADVKYWIVKGEKTTWPLISLIKNRCIIEFAIERTFNKLRKEHMVRQEKEEEEYMTKQYIFSAAGRTARKSIH
ncbi:hypothetical protein HMI54_004883 [Coelomomyces lativittatus]|nr:hypothetical protein HMI56_000710 [Coelomomyces lativittatus]KAJ1506666.1 hypothetical protein HMI54_004883 [Coelomomyces lativittatus]KAJ1516759.1 hypothetical protein HMI55_001479 [Coelomomyces lativittatus]